MNIAVQCELSELTERFSGGFVSRFTQVYLHFFFMFRFVFAFLYVVISTMSPENPRVSAILAPSRNFAASTLVSHFTCILMINSLVKRSLKGNGK